MNFKTTIALFLLLAAVGGYFYFVEYGNTTGYEAHQQQRDTDTSTAVGELVFTDEALTAEAIDRIELTRGGRSIKAEKSGDDWFQTDPVRFRLDSYTPDSVARQFAGLRYVQRIEPGNPDAASDTPSAAQMGLDKPRAIVTVGEGDKSWTLKLGRLAVDGHGYAQVEGEDTAYVVEPALFGTLLDQQTDDWRSKSLGTYSASASDRITLHQPDADLIDLYKLDGVWWFDTDTIQRTSEAAIDELFSAISRVWITEFVEDNPENLTLYGLDNPHLEIILQTPSVFDPDKKQDDNLSSAGTTTRRLKIGRTDLEGKSRYATWSRDDDPTLVVFTIDAASADNLTRTRDDLRDPRVLTVSAQDVRSLTVSQNDAVTLSLLRDPQSGYSFGEPKPAFGIDYSTTHAMVKQLCELQATAYTIALNDLAAPIASLNIGSASGSDTRLSLYKTGDTHTIVTEGEGVGYVVEANELIQQLTGPADALRKRTVLDISAEEIVGITLRHPDGITYVFSPGEESGWSLAGHETFEDTRLDSLIASLNPLRAAHWLPGPVTPTADWIELTLAIKDGSPITLHADPQSLHATLSETEGGFVLPASFVDLLVAEYRERSLHMPGVDQIESIKLTGRNVEVILSRNGQQYISDHGEVDQAIAAKTFDTLAGLRAQRYTAPLSLRPEDIDFTLEATTHEGNTVTLRIVVGDDPDLVTATIDPAPGADHTGWVTLRASDVLALRTALTDLESPTK